MILGMTLSTFTTLHVVISLIGIGSGLVVMYGLLVVKRLNGITTIFLVTTILARYAFHLAGAWRAIYVICASIALYLNVFVLVVQLFEKVPAVRALAPTQKEPPFLVAQVALLILFIALTILATKKFRTEAVRLA
jgi:hypothetical protein